MKAMILAAGLGTRLDPITRKVPKALAEIKGKPLLGLLIRKLAGAGFTDIIVNIHHFPDQIRDYLKKSDFGHLRVEISDESEQLLDTGGGLKKAGWFFDDGKPFLLHNVDVVSSLDLREIYNAHLRKAPLATLAVSDRSTGRYLLFNDDGLLRGWMNRKSGETRPGGIKIESLHPYAFSGIHVIDPSIFNLIREKGRFSLIELYLRLSAKANIRAYVHNSSKWLDIGIPAALEKANREIPNDFFD